jgi:hypothetical protein
MSAGGRAKPLVDEAITTITLICPGASMLFYRAALPLSRQTLSYVAGVIRQQGSSQNCIVIWVTRSRAAAMSSGRGRPQSFSAASVAVLACCVRPRPADYSQ